MLTACVASQTTVSDDGAGPALSADAAPALSLSSDGSLSDDAVSGDSASENTVSEDSVSEDSVSEDSVSENEPPEPTPVPEVTYVPPLTNYVGTDVYDAAIPDVKMDTAPLAALMNRAAKGEDITIAVIGGSITQGTAAAGTKDESIAPCYADTFFMWWKACFPHSNIECINAGIAGTDSYLGVHRVQKDVLDKKPDLVLIEFSVNDQGDRFYMKSYENLVRDVMQSPSSPAVMLLLMARTDKKTACVNHSKIGAHYDLPMIDYASAEEYMMNNGMYTASDLSGDKIHPSFLGHSIISELLCEYLNYVHGTRKQLLMNAGFSKDAESVLTSKKYSEDGKSRILPEPVTDASYRHAKFLTGEDLAEKVTECGTFYGGTPDNWAFPKGFTVLQGDGGLTFKMKFANLGIYYIQTGTADMAVYNVYVDGNYAGVFDGKGRGMAAVPCEIYHSDKVAEHTVTFVRSPFSFGTRFELLGLMISEP